MHCPQLSEFLSRKCVDLLLKNGIKACATGTHPCEWEPEVLNNSSTNAFLADHSNFEAVASALVLRILLVKALSSNPDDIPYIHPEGAELMPTVKLILITCTQGAFQQPQFLRAIIKAAQLEAKYLPILADESFRFPDQQFVNE